MDLVRKMQDPIAMRIAIPQWQGRIAPVFDVAGQLLLVDVDGGRETHREIKGLANTDLPARATELRACGVDVLLCGAISAPLQLTIAVAGVRVIPFLCGSVDAVLAAYLDGTLARQAFVMPGCRRWRWRGRGRNQETANAEDSIDNAARNISTCTKCGEKMRYKNKSNRLQCSCPKCGATVTPP